jgi:AcrR family transcriptional regulator
MGEHAGRGDAARTMALLWGTGKPATRGPRPALRLERIVRKAITLADAGGLGAASIRRVAEALSIGTMSLYVYVPGKGELLELMVDRVVGEQPLPSGDRGWRAGLEQYARDTWSLYGRHPWLLEVATSRTVLGPHVMARFDAALGVARRAGLRGKDAVAVVSLVDGYTRGAARVAVEATEAPAGTGQTDDEWWTERAPVLDQHLGAAMAGGRLQNVAAVAAEGAFDQAEGGASHTLQRALDEFEFGLQRVLDGVEAFVNRPRPARARSRRTSHRRGTRPSAPPGPPGRRSR